MKKQKIVINGKEYNSFEELPPEMRPLFKDQNQDGIPDSLENIVQNAKKYGFGNALSGTQSYADMMNQAQNLSNSLFRKVFFIIFLTLLPFIIIGVVLYFITGGNFMDLFYQGTVNPPGDVTHFDPISTFNEVKAYAGSAVQLGYLEADQVRYDGTMNLKAEYEPPPSLRYRFYRLLQERPQNAPPVGAGGTDGQWYEPINVTIRNPGEWRYMKRIGGAYNFEGNYYDQGMEKDVSPPVGKLWEKLIEDPTCSFKDLWSTALTQGAPKDAVAEIKYSEQGYDFVISDAKVNLSFGQDCKLKK